MFFYPREFAKNPDYRTPALAHEVPIATVRDGVYVLTDGSMAACFRVQGMVYDLASMRETATFVDGLQSVLNTVPPGVQIKVLHRITHNYREWLEAHDQEINGSNSFARYVAWDQARRYWRAMDSGVLLRSDNLVVLTYNPKVRWWEAPNKLQSLMTATLSVSEAGSVVQRTLQEYRLALDKFEEMISRVTRQMSFAGLKPQRLQTQELYDLAWEVLNPKLSLRQPTPSIRVPSARDPYSGLFADRSSAKVAAKRPDLTVVTPISEREQLCASDWRVGDNWVRIGDTYYAAIYLRMLPTHVYPSLALSLAGLPFEATLSFDAVMLQKQKELDKQWSEARSEESKAEATLFGATPDPAKQREAQEKRQRYLQLASSHENPFAFRMVIVVSAPDQRTLNQRADSIISLLRNMEGAQGIREHFAVDTLLKSTWPFALITDVNARKALTSHIASLLPLFSRWEGSRRPITLVMDRMKRLVRHDPFPVDQLNRNRIICGKSGSGKSFATQLADIQPHAARDGTEILIVESGGSFELTTRCFGGTNIKLGPSSPYQINPFDLPPGFESMPEDKQEIELRYKYGFIKNLVLAMARLHDPESQMLAENVVGAVTQRTYAESRSPRFRDFFRLLGEYRNAEDPQAEQLAGRLRTRLSNYVVDERGNAGIYSAYFDCTTNFDTDSAIVAFDLMDVKNDPALLIPMTMVVILGLIYNRIMRRDGKERLVIIDEAWALVKDMPDGSQSPAGQGIELFWREGRKLGASSTMISQNFSDMTGDAVGRAVVGNSPLQYFLVHERLQANDEAFRAAAFSDEKLDTVYSLQTQYGAFSEILIKEGESWGVVQLPSVGLKYWLATTDPKDADVLRRYMKTFRDGYGMDERTVVAILAEDYPGGVHAEHGRPMSEQEALQFAEHWNDHFARFTAMVQAGTPIPPTFE